MKAAADVALLPSPVLPELLPDYDTTHALIPEAAEVHLPLPPLRFMAFILIVQCPQMTWN